MRATTQTRPRPAGAPAFRTPGFRARDRFAAHASAALRSAFSTTPNSSAFLRRRAFPVFMVRAPVTPVVRRYRIGKPLRLGWLAYCYSFGHNRFNY